MTGKKVIELFGLPTSPAGVDWKTVVSRQHCPFLNRKCLKNRKSEPDIAIGTCSVRYGVRDPKNILICPHRMVGRGTVFTDCLHLLKLHEPGNELHRIEQVDIPGGSVDFFLVSVNNDQVVDFVGIELQTLDTTGTVWPERQSFLQSVGVKPMGEFDPSKSFGMNWKMTAKTILVQLHHKVETFESLGKHIVLAMQDVLLDYMMREFKFAHIRSAKTGHSLHFHSYSFEQVDSLDWKLRLSSRLSTDMLGMSVALGLQAPARVELESIMAKLQSKISSNTLLEI